MKALAPLIAAALVSGMVALALGAAVLQPRLTWLGLALLGIGVAGYYFTP